MPLTILFPVRRRLHRVVHCSPPTSSGHGKMLVSARMKISFRTPCWSMLMTASTYSDASNRGRACHDSPRPFVLTLLRSHGHLAAASQAPPFRPSRHACFAHPRRDTKRRQFNHTGSSRRIRASTAGASTDLPRIPRVSLSQIVAHGAHYSRVWVGVRDLPHGRHCPGSKDTRRIAFHSDPPLLKPSYHPFGSEMSQPLAYRARRPQAW